MKKVLYLFSAFVFSFMALQIPSTKAATCVDLKTNLYQGVSKKKDEVKLLQQFLFENNYLSVSPTGTFGPSTAAALKKFQKDNALSPASGLAGELTRKAVKEKSCGGVVSVVATSTISSTVVASSTPVASSTLNTPKICSQEIKRCANGSIMLRDQNCGWVENSCNNLLQVNYCQADKSYPNTGAYGSCICPSFTSLSYVDSNKNYICKTINQANQNYYIQMDLSDLLNSTKIVAINNIFNFPEKVGKMIFDIYITNDSRKVIPCDSFVKYKNENYINISRDRYFYYDFRASSTPESIRLVCGDDVSFTKTVKDYLIQITPMKK